MFDIDIFEPDTSDIKKNKNKKNEILSFSKLKFTQVSNAWKKACINADLETASRWTVEMILSKWLHLWIDQLILFSAKSIHVENPKIPCFIHKIINDYPQISNEQLSIESIRNNHQFKQAIILLLGACCYSPKGVHYPSLNIKISDYELQNGIDKLRNIAIQPIILSISSKYNCTHKNNIIFSLFSLYYFHITNFNLNQALKILSWIIFIEKQKNYKNLFNFSNDIDWIFFNWEILNIISSQCPQKKNIIHSWRELFYINYDPKTIKKFPLSQRNKRMNIIVASVIILSQNSIKDIKCIQNYDSIKKACSNIDSMFQFVITENKKSIINESYGF